MDPSEKKIVFDEMSLISKLVRLGGTGQPFNMDNKIEFFKVDKNGDRELLFTTYELWNKRGYSLRIIKSKSCQLQDSYIKGMIKKLLPIIRYPVASKLEIAEEDS